jgi:hypothetical protein
LRFTRNKTFIIVALLIWFISLDKVRLLRWKGDNKRAWENTIASDGNGYYAYLPAILIYQDFEYKFVDKIDQSGKYKLSKQGSGFVNTTSKGDAVNKYYCGVAIMMLPFFLIAYFLSYLGGYDLDGYSILFQKCASFGALVYVIIALFFLRKVLMHYKLKEWQASILVGFFYFGSNLYYYTILEPSMSHVYSFTAISVFIWLMIKAIHEGKRQHFIFGAALLGLIILIRPTNGIVVFAIPFLAGNSETLKTFFKRLIHDKKWLFIYFGVSFAVIFIQLLLYYAQSGNFIIWSYTDEGFNFLNPQFFNVWFSYKKGLFVYTPLAFISLFGLLALAKKRRYESISILGFLLLVFYIISSWENWYYGDSFGHRASIDFFPFFIVLLGFAFYYIPRIGKVALSAVIGCCIFINVVQTEQYHYYVLHGNSMTKERYWKVFLKTHPKYRGIFQEEDLKKTERTLIHHTVYFNDFESTTNTHLKSVTSNKAFGGNHSLVLKNSTQEQSLFFTFDELLLKDPSRLRISMMANKSSNDIEMEIYVMAEHEKKGIVWSKLVLNNKIEYSNNWEEVRMRAEVPVVYAGSDSLQLLLFNRSSSPVYLDNIKIETIKL